MFDWNLNVPLTATCTSFPKSLVRTRAEDKMKLSETYVEPSRTSMTSVIVVKLGPKYTSGLYIILPTFVSVDI